MAERRTHRSVSGGSKVLRRQLEFAADERMGELTAIERECDGATHRGSAKSGPAFSASRSVQLFAVKRYPPAAVRAAAYRGEGGVLRPRVVDRAAATCPAAAPASIPVR